MTVYSGVMKKKKKNQRLCIWAVNEKDAIVVAAASYIYINNFLGNKMFCFVPRIKTVLNRENIYYICFYLCIPYLEMIILYYSWIYNKKKPVESSDEKKKPTHLGNSWELLLEGKELMIFIHAFI